MRNPSPLLPSAGACSPGKAALLRFRPSHCRFSLRAFLFQKMENFLDADQHSVIHDGLPNLSQFVFIHSSLDDAGLDPYEFRIFCHLRRRAKDRTAYPGMRSIAESTGISVSKVCTVIRSLQEKTFLIVHKRLNNQSNLYLVRVPGECSLHEQGVLTTNAGVRDTNERVSNEGNPLKGSLRSSEAVSSKHLHNNSDSAGGSASQQKEKKKKLNADSVLQSVRPDLTLQSSDFLKAWRDWVEYRLQLPAATLLGFQRHILSCARLGQQDAIEAINNSISKGWRSPELPFSSNQSKPEKKTTPGRYERINR